MEAGYMTRKKLTLESKAVKRAVHDLHLESMKPTLDIQSQVLDEINSGKKITPSMIKRIAGHGKVSN
jgi:hypothetical protein